MLSSGFLKFFYFILLIVSIYFSFVTKLEFWSRNIIIPIIFAFISALFFFLRKDYFIVKKSAIRISVLFLLSFFITYFQRYIDLLLGYIDPYDYLAISLPYSVNKAVWISLSGLLAFFLGYLFYKKDNINRKSNFFRTTKPLQKKKVLFLCYILFFAYLLTIDFSYFKGNYGKMELNSWNAYITVFFHSSLYLYIVMRMVNNIYYKVGMKRILDILKEDLFYLLLLFSYLTLVLFSGDRGPIISYLLSYFVMILFISKYNINYKSFISIIFIASIFVTFLGIFRNVTEANSIEEKYQIASERLSYKDNSILNFTSELANSVRTLHASVESVEYKGIWYGYFNCYYLLSAIPMSGTFFSNLGILGETGTSAEYLTFYLQGDLPEYGDGTSCIAELYLDFGMFAVVFGMFLLGSLLRKIDLITSYIEKPNIFSVIVVVAYFAFIIQLPRGSFLQPMKTIFFVYILYLVLNIIDRKKYDRI